MAVTEVGTPSVQQSTGSGSPASEPGVWGTGQTRAAGDLLVALVTAAGTTSAGATAQTSGTTGWTKVYEGGGTFVKAAIWTKVATGADAAPSFDSTIAGTSARCRTSVTLYQLHDSAAGRTPAADTGNQATGTSASPLPLTTAGNVAGAGEVALAAQCILGTGSGANTWGTVGSWGVDGTDAATTYNHFVVATLVGPASGATLSYSPTHSYTSTGTAGAIAVFKPGPPVTQSGTAQQAAITAALAADGTVVPGAAPVAGDAALTVAVALAADGVVPAAGVTAANSFNSLGDGTTQTVANSGASGDAFNEAVRGAGSVFQGDADAAHGAGSLLVTTAATPIATYVGWTSATFGTGPGRLWFRIYAKMPNLTAPTFRLANLLQGTTLCAGLNVITGTGAIRMVNSAAATIITSTGITAGQWFRVEGYLSGGLTAATYARLQVFTGANVDGTTPDYDSGALDGTGTVALQSTAGLADHIRAGVCNAVVASVRIDELAGSTAGPLGPAAAGPSTWTGDASLPVTAAVAAAGARTTSGQARLRVPSVAEYITPEWQASLINTADPSLAAWIYRSTTFGTLTYSAAAPPAPHAYGGLPYTPALRFTAVTGTDGLLAAIAAGDTAAYSWVLYDNEWETGGGWPTPQIEADDPWTYMRQFAAAAHAAGLKAIITPARDLGNNPTSVHPKTGGTLDDWYVTVWPDGDSIAKAASEADIWVIQTQADQADQGAYDALYSTCLGQSQAANPDHACWAEVSVTYGDSANMAACAQSVTAPGVYVVMPNSDPGFSTGVGFFRLMRQAGNVTITADGTVGAAPKTGDAALAATATPAAAGQVSHAGAGQAVTVTAALAADGAVTPAGGAAVARDTTGVTRITAAGLSATINITAAAVGSDVYALVALGSYLSTGITIPGWDQLLEGAEGTGCRYGFFHRRKLAGDTTFTVSWSATNTRGIITWASYTGLGATAHEGVNVKTPGAGTTAATNAMTPTAADRWALMFTWQRSTSLATDMPDGATWTAAAGLAEQLDASQVTSSNYMSSEVADSGAAVTQASHTYTATSVYSNTHAGAVGVFLIPGAAGGATWTGDASLAVTAAPAAAGLVSGSAGATAVPVQAALTAAGALAAARDAQAVTVTAAPAAGGQVTRVQGAAALTETAALAAAGQAVHQGAASLAVSAAITAAGAVGNVTLPVNVTAAVAAAGQVSGGRGASPLAVSATISADGTTGAAPKTGDASLAVAAALAAAGQVAGGAGAGAVTATATPAATGQVTRVQGSPGLAVTAALAAVGAASHPGSAGLAVAAAVAADGTTGAAPKTGDASLAVSVAAAAAGAVDRPADASAASVTATLMAAGQVTRVQGSPGLTVTAALVASGTVTGGRGAQPLAVTAALAATGAVGTVAQPLTVTAAVSAAGQVTRVAGATPLVVTATITTGRTAAYAGQASLLVVAVPSAAASRTARATAALAIVAALQAQGIAGSSMPLLAMLGMGPAHGQWTVGAAHDGQWSAGAAHGQWTVGAAHT